MNTPFENFQAWAAPGWSDFCMSLGILAIWFASEVLPTRHPAQAALREAIRSME